RDPVDGKPRSLRGKVLSVDPQVLQEGRFRLHAEIINQPSLRDETQWQLRPGVEVQMKVFVTAAVAQRNSAPAAH
ncbi:MAG: hypothetical protein MI861_24885, partial [Pirellulales bacterium]|nr:hypothetical protein [Pirellulales bacterium]